LPIHAVNGENIPSHRSSRWAYGTPNKLGCRRLKGLDIYTPPLTWTWRQRFTVWSGVLTGNDTSWRCASSGSPLPERTDLPAVCSYNRPTYVPARRNMAYDYVDSRLIVVTTPGQRTVQNKIMSKICQRQLDLW